MPAYSIFALGTFEFAWAERTIMTQFYHACEEPKLMLHGLINIFNITAIENNVNQAVSSIVQWIKTYNYLENANSLNEVEYKINLAGYSRGAVTCVRIANRLYKYLNANKIKDCNNKIIKIDQVKLNIFGIDPVAGIFEKRDREARDVPPIVENYIATLQIHDCRKDFAPQDMSRTRILDTGKTKVIFVPMYGYHCASTKIMNSALYHSAEITWQLLYRFLTKHGSELSGMPAIVSDENNLNTLTLLSDIELLNLFALAKKNKDKYEAAAEWGFSLSGQGVRSFVANIDHYVQDSDFFINQVERDLFKKCYPEVFGYFFKIISYKQYNHQEIYNELSRMYSESPLIFDNLKCKGVIRDEKSTIHFPNLTRVKIDQEENVAKHLIKDIILLLYFYRRSKSEWMAYSVGNEYSRSLKIESDLKCINKKPISSKEKVKQILDLIEKHYCDLFQSNSSNKLMFLLEDVLYKYKRTYSKEVIHVNLIYEIIRLSGSGAKLLGEALKNIGRAGAFIVGATSVAIDVLANCLMYTRVLWLPGKLLNYIAIAGKSLSTSILSPILESFGNFLRGAGKCLIKFSGIYVVRIRSRVEDEKTYSEPLVPQNMNTTQYMKGSLFNQSLSINKKVVTTSVVNVKPTFNLGSKNKLTFLSSKSQPALHQKFLDNKPSF